MKKISIVLSILLGSLCVFVGCSTTKDVENNLSVVAEKSAIVDWSNRTLGVEPVPEWLPKLVGGNTNFFYLHTFSNKVNILMQNTYWETSLNEEEY